MKTRLITTAFLSLLLLAGSAHAAFETWGISVRARGMGNAMAATHGDINSLSHNPAGLASIKSIQLILNYDMPVTGMNEDTINIFNASFAAPYVANKAINWPGTLFNLLSFGLTKKFFQNGGYGVSFYMLSDEIYYERAISFALSRKLDNLLNTGLNFSIGARFNVFMRGVNDNEYVSANPYFDNGTSTAGFGMDLGIIMHLSPKFHIGAYMNNVVKPNMAINDSVATEYLDPSLRYGITWNVGDISFMKHLTVAYSRTSIGKESGDIREAPTINHFGFEFWQLKHMLAFRAGYEFGDDLSNISVGLSFDLPLGNHELQLDYAWVLPLKMSSTYGSHLVSLQYKIRLGKSYFEFDDKKRKEMRRIEDLTKKAGSGGSDDKKDSGKSGGDGKDDKKGGIDKKDGK